LEKLPDVMHNAVVRQGWIINGQPQEVWAYLAGIALSDQEFTPGPGMQPGPF